MEPITEDTTIAVIERANEAMTKKEASDLSKDAGILVTVPQAKLKGEAIDPKGLKAVHRMRRKFEGHGAALDTLLYHLLHAHYKEDLKNAIKRSHAFCVSEPGVKLYREACCILKKADDEDCDSDSDYKSESDCESDSGSESDCSTASSSDDCSRTETDDCSSAYTEEIYDFSTEWAKAARHHNGLLTMRPSYLSPDYSTLQSLYRFSKGCR